MCGATAPYHTCSVPDLSCSLADCRTASDYKNLVCVDSSAPTTPISTETCGQQPKGAPNACCSPNAAWSIVYSQCTAQDCAGTTFQGTIDDAATKCKVGGNIVDDSHCIQLGVPRPTGTSSCPKPTGFQSTCKWKCSADGTTWATCTADYGWSACADDSCQGGGTQTRRVQCEGASNLGVEACANDGAQAPASSKSCAKCGTAMCEDLSNPGTYVNCVTEKDKTFVCTSNNDAVECDAELTISRNVACLVEGIAKPDVKYCPAVVPEAQVKCNMPCPYTKVAWQGTPAYGECTNPTYCDGTGGTQKAVSGTCIVTGTSDQVHARNCRKYATTGSQVSCTVPNRTCSSALTWRCKPTGSSGAGVECSETDATQWTACSGCALGSTQTREVSCPGSSESECLRPSTTKPPTLKACSVCYTWGCRAAGSTGPYAPCNDATASQWTACTGCALGSTQTREVVCEKPDGTFSDTFCPASKPATTQQCRACLDWKCRATDAGTLATCNDNDATQWTVCSGCAAGSTQTRQVRCPVGDGTFDDSRCASDAKPLVSRTCSLCRDWKCYAPDNDTAYTCSDADGPQWSRCSGCAVGSTRTRRVRCPDGNGGFDSTYCDAASMPATSSACTLCGTWQCGAPGSFHTCTVADSPVCTKDDVCDRKSGAGGTSDADATKKQVNAQCIANNVVLTASHCTDVAPSILGTCPCDSTARWKTVGQGECTTQSSSCAGGAGTQPVNASATTCETGAGSALHSSHCTKGTPGAAPTTMACTRANTCQWKCLQLSNNAWVDCTTDAAWSACPNDKCEAGGIQDRIVSCGGAEFLQFSQCLLDVAGAEPAGTRKCNICGAWRCKLQTSNEYVDCTDERTFTSCEPPAGIEGNCDDTITRSRTVKCETPGKTGDDYCLTSAKPQPTDAILRCSLACNDTARWAVTQATDCIDHKRCDGSGGNRIVMNVECRVGSAPVPNRNCFRYDNAINGTTQECTVPGFKCTSWQCRAPGSTANPVACSATDATQWSRCSACIGGTQTRTLVCPNPIDNNYACNAPSNILATTQDCSECHKWGCHPSAAVPSLNCTDDRTWGPCLGECNLSPQQSRLAQCYTNTDLTASISNVYCPESPALTRGCDSCVAGTWHRVTTGPCTGYRCDGTLGTQPVDYECRNAAGQVINNNNCLLSVGQKPNVFSVSCTQPGVTCPGIWRCRNQGSNAYVDCSLPTTWGDCPAPCNTTANEIKTDTHTRPIFCVINNVATSLSDKCSEPIRPPVIETCYGPVCPSYTWDVVEDKGCAYQCKDLASQPNATRSTRPRCLENHFLEVAASRCNSATKPAAETFQCPTPLCSAFQWRCSANLTASPLVEDGTWYTCANPGSFSGSLFTPCSRECGSGNRKRVVSCFDMSNPASPVPTDPSHCAAGVTPPLWEVCNTSPCPTYSWKEDTAAAVACPACLAADGTTSNVGRRVYKCVNDATGATAASSALCTTPDPSFSFACTAQPCPSYVWVIGDYGPCDVECAFGEQKRNVYCAEANQRLVPVTESLCYVEDPLKPGSTGKPETTRSCAEPVCDKTVTHWEVGPWRPCSADCKKAAADPDPTRTRELMCKSGLGVNLTIESCGTVTRPTLEETCNTIPCPARWVPSAWSVCDKTCGGGQQTRTYQCMNAAGTEAAEVSRCGNTPPPSTVQSCNTQPCPRWLTGDYGKCSSICGPGEQFRDIKCVNYLNTTLDDASCSATLTKPAGSRSCHTEAIHACPYWFSGEWSACSKTCGGGIRFREVACMVSRGDGTWYKDVSSVKAAACENAVDVQPMDWQVCEPQACGEATWHIESWEECSSVCGNSGIQRRTVNCLFANGTIDASDRACIGDVTGLMDEEIAAKIPARLQNCNRFPCSALAWRVLSETPCTAVQCGTGLKSRIVRCTRTVNDVITTLEDKFCAVVGAKPASIISCDGPLTCNAANGGGRCENFACVCSNGFWSPATGCTTSAALEGFTQAPTTVVAGSPLTVRWKYSGKNFQPKYSVYLVPAGTENALWIGGVTATAEQFSYEVPYTTAPGRYFLRFFYNRNMKYDTTQFVITDSCEAILCENGGTCNRKTATCDCPAAYTGPSCSVSACTSSLSSCNNHGTCDVSGSAAKCVCNPGYAGPTCAINLSTCPGNTAVTCAHGALSSCTACDCTYGQLASSRWYGATCSQCAYTCNTVGTTGVNSDCSGCVCKDGYTGRLCACQSLRIRLAFTGVKASDSEVFVKSFERELTYILSMDPTKLSSTHRVNGTNVMVTFDVADPKCSLTDQLPPSVPLQVDLDDVSNAVAAASSTSARGMRVSLVDVSVGGNKYSPSIVHPNLQSIASSSSSLSSRSTQDAARANVSDVSPTFIKLTASSTSSSSAQLTTISRLRQYRASLLAGNADLLNLANTFLSLFMNPDSDLYRGQSAQFIAQSRGIGLEDPNCVGDNCPKSVGAAGEEEIIFPPAPAPVVPEDESWKVPVIVCLTVVGGIAIIFGMLWRVRVVKRREAEAAAAAAAEAKKKRGGRRASSIATGRVSVVSGDTGGYGSTTAPPGTPIVPAPGRTPVSSSVVNGSTSSATDGKKTQKSARAPINKSSNRPSEVEMI